MAASNILGLHAHNFSGGTEELIAVYHRTPMVWKGTYWKRGATLTNNKEAYMTSFANKVLLVNDTDSNLEYNGSYWTFNESMQHSPVAKFIFNHQSKVFLYGLKIDNGGDSVLEYPSRFWESDFPRENTLRWGLQYGPALNTTAGSAVVTDASALFASREIKIGDDFFITQGLNKRAKNFEVLSIDSDTQITLTETLTFTSTTER